MKQIENLNKRNVQGYNSFAEYCIADDIMIGYFDELKKIEKRLPSLTVDSYDKFEQSTFEQLNGYDKLNVKQYMQVEHELYNYPARIDKENIKKFLGNISCPIYFLDFDNK